MVYGTIRFRNLLRSRLFSGLKSQLMERGGRRGGFGIIPSIHPESRIPLRIWEYQVPLLGWIRSKIPSKIPSKIRLKIPSKTTPFSSQIFAQIPIPAPKCCFLFQQDPRSRLLGDSKSLDWEFRGFLPRFLPNPNPSTKVPLPPSSSIPDPDYLMISNPRDWEFRETSPFSSQTFGQIPTPAIFFSSRIPEPNYSVIPIPRDREFWDFSPLDWCEGCGERV